MQLSRLTAVMLVLLLAGAGSADAERRAPSKAEQRMSFSGHAEEAPAPASDCARDTTGDTVSFESLDDLDAPEGDIVHWCATYGDALVLRLRTAAPIDPYTDARWRGFTLASWQIDVDDDGSADFQVEYAYGPELAVRVYRTIGDFEERCVVDARYEDGELITGAIARACIGGRLALAVSANLLLDTDPADEKAPLSLDETAFDVHVQGAPAAPGVPNRDARRLAGADRYATAAAVSREAFPDGALIVYLVRADSVADLAATSALALKSPVLPVPPCGQLPAVIAAEIQRLAPMEVVAVGGVDAICEDMVLQASAA